MLNQGIDTEGVGFSSTSAQGFTKEQFLLFILIDCIRKTTMFVFTKVLEVYMCVLGSFSLYSLYTPLKRHEWSAAYTSSNRVCIRQEAIDE